MNVMQLPWKYIRTRLCRDPENFRASIDGFRMVLDISDKGISRTLYYNGGREKAFMSLIGRTVRPGMVCLDIGANIGYTALHMLRLAGPDGFLYAVEPDPHNLRLLKNNVELNGFSSRCEVIEAAITNFTGQTEFWLADRPNISSMEKTGQSDRMITVRALDLQSLLESRRFPDFIKMDVEGHEVEILKRGYDYLGRSGRNLSILLEVHPHRYAPQNDFEDVLKRYFAAGFGLQYVISTPVARPTPIAEAGCEPDQIVRTDGYERGIYRAMANEDLLRFLRIGRDRGSGDKIIRAIMISKN